MYTLEPMVQSNIYLVQIKIAHLSNTNSHEKTKDSCEKSSRNHRSLTAIASTRFQLKHLIAAFHAVVYQKQAFE